MGQSKQRGTYEQRLVLAKERDKVLRDMFADQDHTAKVVRDALLLTPMTPERLETLKERSQKMIPG